jgi:cell wall-associated NlpC family hydrolase
MNHLWKAALAICLCLIFLPGICAADETAFQGAQEVVVQLGTQIHRTGLDCSHFVHSLYEHAGLPYEYATSRRLYRGLESFERVGLPKPGDLAVWPGHVGIVVKPEEHTFLSAIASGVKISSYASPYWIKRGDVHFFRYQQESPQG